MKKALFSITAVMVFVSTAFSANPLLRQKYTADPTPFVWNDRLYIYASFDNNNPSGSGYDIKFYTLMSTDDMANWTDHGEVFSVSRDLSSYNQAYAPGAAVKNNKVYLYIPNGGSGIGVASADRPEGPWSGGKQMITGSSGNTNVPWLFDPAGFVDSDGQGYVYFGGGPADGNPGPGQNLRVAKLNSDMMSAQFPATTISGSTRSFEAAYMHKNGSNYYFSYSQNFTNGSADIAYMMGTNPMGPFTFKGTMLPNSASGGGNNHAGVVQYKNNWYIAYHDRKLKSSNGNPSGEFRSVSVDKLEYNSDGTIKSVTATNDGPAQIKNFNPYDTVLATTMYKQSGKIKTAICSAPNPGTISNSNKDSPGTAGDRCVMLVSIENNSWVNLKSVDFGTTGATKFVVRAASAATGGSIEIRTGSNTGTLVGTCEIGATGGITTWKEIECDLSSPITGVKDYLVLVFKGSANFRISKYIFKTSGTTPSSSSSAALSSSSARSSSSSAASPSSSSARPSSSSSVASQACDYQASFCGDVAWKDVLGGSDAMPTEGQCLYIGDFGIIQPNLNSIVSINGVENTCGDEWDGCPYNDRPATKDGGYYVYVKLGTINGYIPEDEESPNGWKGIVAKPKPNCSTTTPITNYSPVVTSHSPTYYSLKGEPLGSAKPQKAGIYIVKQGYSVKKIVVR